MRVNEQRHIFDKAKFASVVKKKANTLRIWYGYLAVLSGSYLYFYALEGKVIKIAE